MFTREDWQLFRSLGTLGQKAGVPQHRLAALVMKELADNALDAGADCAVGEVAGKPGTYYVQDDGPGIPGTDEEIASLFSIRRPMTSSKLLRLPTRGALGNGLRVVAGAVLASGGTLRVRTGGRVLALAPRDDGGTTATRVIDGATTLGTRVEITFGGELAGQGALYMAQLAVQFRGESWYKGKSSPHWYDSDSFFELMQAAGRPLADVLALLDTRGTKIKEVISDLKKRTHRLGAGDLLSKDLTRDECEALLLTLREGAPEATARVLGEVGELNGIRSAHGYAKKTGDIELSPGRGSVSAKLPVTVEVWARRIGEFDSQSCHVFINRTPITAHIGIGRDKTGRKWRTWISGCGLSNYFDFPGKHPVTLFICVTTPYMPITTDGKEPNLKPIHDLLEAAIELAGKRAKAPADPTGTGETLSSVIFDLIPEGIDNASESGKYRFSLRQLYYAIRPLVQGAGREEPKYKYFSDVISDYETMIGRDVPGMYRDARGVLYIPHENDGEGLNLSLGTLNVERFVPPKHRVGNVLYIEKGGFLPLLLDNKWAERHDCAILTSQGFATRAVRDMIDLLGDSDEPLRFFCVHDADGPGTMIHQALTEATKARPARRVEVINLGLDPWEARAMGLLSEEVDAKKAVPVAEYIRRHSRIHGGTDWAVWLQENRYELNAMTSPQFIRWLDDKMAEHGAGKIVPPDDYLEERFLARTKSNLRDMIIKKLIEEQKVDERVEELMSFCVPAHDLREQVADLIDGTPDPWEAPTEVLAIEAAKELL